MVDEHRKKQVDALHAKTRYSLRLFAVNGRQRPVDHLTGDESDNSSHHGRLCFSTAHSYGLENTGIQSQKRVLVQPRPFSTEIATTTKILKSHYRYAAEGRGFVFSSR